MAMMIRNTKRRISLAQQRKIAAQEIQRGRKGDEELEAAMKAAEARKSMAAKRKEAKAEKKGEAAGLVAAMQKNASTSKSTPAPAKPVARQNTERGM